MNQNSEAKLIELFPDAPGDAEYRLSVNLAEFRIESTLNDLKSVRLETSEMFQAVNSALVAIRRFKDGCSFPAGPEPTGNPGSEFDHVRIVKRAKVLLGQRRKGLSSVVDVGSRGVVA